ncbi:MAG: sugar ABC transporter substrate-binding protein [Elusimicrobiota bacterium]
MFRKFKLELLLVFVMVVGLFAGCGKKSEDTTVAPGQIPIKVAFWGAVEEKDIITDTVRRWEKDHPNIKVILEHIPASYQDKVLTEIAGGNPPDIIFCEVNVFVTFFYKNALLDLTSFLKKDKDFNIKEFFPEVVARFTRNGKVFCIPRDTAPFACVFYNKDLFKKMGVPFPKDSWNFDQFLDTAKKLTLDENGKHPGEPGFNEKKIKQYGYHGWSWHNFVYAFGGKFVDDINNPTKCLLDQPAAQKGLQYSIDLAFKHFVSARPDAVSNMGLNSCQMFTMQKTAMFQSGIWETPNLRRMIAKNFDWDVAMFPKSNTGKRAFGTGGSGYAIMSMCKNPDEAWEVIKCLAGDYGQEMLADTGLAQPANMRIAKGKHWAQDTKPPLNKGMLNEAVKYVVYDPFHPLWNEAWQRFIIPNIDLINGGRISPKEGMDKGVPKANALLTGKRQ